MTEHRMFQVTRTKEVRVDTSAIFPAYLHLSDSSNSGGGFWDFWVRIGLLQKEGSDVRIDFLIIDSEGEYKFETMTKKLSQLGEYFAGDSSYERVTAEKFNEKIDSLMSILKTVPRE